VVGLLLMLTVIALVSCFENVESKLRIRGRSSVPSCAWWNVGCASTGRIRPPPGWSPTLLFVKDVSQ
jgi:hypothetical protein